MTGCGQMTVFREWICYGVILLAILVGTTNKKMAVKSCCWLLNQKFVETVVDIVASQEGQVM